MMKAFSLFICILLLVPAAFGQGPATGFPPYSSFQTGQFDNLNLQNLNINFAIPIVSMPGRGMSFDFPIVYDSSIWQSGTQWTPDSTWGWKTTSPTGNTSFFHRQTIRGCIIIDRWNGYTYSDPAGTRHDFNVWWERYDDCVTVTTDGVLTGYAVDGSGYYIDITNQDIPVVRRPDGKIVRNDTSSGSLADTNGNKITWLNVTANETDWTDTANHTATRVITSGANVEYHYLDAGGMDQKYTLRYQNYPVKTAFGCPTVSDFNVNGTLPQVSLPYELELPNLRKYSFSYEPTLGSPGFVTGRLLQVTLPTVGYYKYEYSGANGGINCADGSAIGLTRTINDGVSSATWQFARSGISGSAGTTTVTEPVLSYDAVGNNTVHTFDASGHETTQKIYQGTAGGTPLRTITTSWTTPPAGTPITPLSRVTTLEDGTTQSETDTTYDPVTGNLQTLKEYDWGLALLRTTTFQYVTDVNYISRNIMGLVSSKTIQDGGGVDLPPSSAHEIIRHQNLLNS